MHNLEAARYLAHIEEESRRFRTALESCDEADVVPACPEWNAADLLWHLAEVQAFWATVITTRPADPEDYEPPERPAAWSRLFESFDESSRALICSLRAAEPTDAAWSWHDEQTVAFTLRRQALEALVHRVDAEQTASARNEDWSTIDDALAADGVHEVLSIFYGGAPPWAEHTTLEPAVEVRPDGHLPLVAGLGVFNGTSPNSGITYHDEPVVDLRAPGTPVAASVSGSASALLLWLWKRSGDSALSFDGDKTVLSDFVAAVSPPLD